MLAIAGGKGGCGKTTTTIGLATALVASGKWPLVVDADFEMPDLHVRLGLDRAPGLSTLASGGPICEAIRYSRDRTGIAICPAGEPYPLSTTALRRLRTWPGPVLVDSPAGVSPDAAAPLTVADATVLVSTDTTESLADTAKTAAMARTLDSPPVGALVRGTCDRHSVGRLLDCSDVVSVPRVDGNPLTDTAVVECHARLGSIVDRFVSSQAAETRTTACRP